MKSALCILPLLLLSGCGSSDSGTNTEVSAPLDSRYFGVWGIDDLATALISKNTVTTYAYNETDGCYEADYYSVVASTANTLTTRDVNSGEVSTAVFSMNGDVLRISEDGYVLDLQPQQIIEPSPACSNVHGVSSITAELSVNYLPPAVTINRSAQQSGYVEYAYELTFDLNKNAIVDAGDIALKVLHFKNASGFADQSVSFTQIGARIWNLVPKQQADQLQSTSTYNAASAVQLQQQQNRLTFTVNTNQHAGLMRIGPNTPVHVRASINYPSPEFVVDDSMLDGPWNWSSANHEDVMPASGFLIPANAAGMELLDAANDQTAGESKWVDITAVKFIFNP